jgi:hypothetical protein
MKACNGRSISNPLPVLLDLHIDDTELFLAEPRHLSVHLTGRCGWGNQRKWLEGRGLQDNNFIQGVKLIKWVTILAVDW